MRSWLVSALLAPLAVGTVACEGRSLTGPDAQRAYARVAADVRVAPAGALVFVDGRRLPPGQGLDQLDPKQIVRIEIVKGAAAVGLYGEEGRAGVVSIFTTQGGQAEPSRRQ